MTKDLMEFKTPYSKSNKLRRLVWGIVGLVLPVHFLALWRWDGNVCYFVLSGLRSRLLLLCMLLLGYFTVAANNG